MKRIPDDVIRRLPLYLRKLDSLYEKGVQRVSSGELCRSLYMQPAQLRQDLEYFGDFPQTSFAYDVDMLRGELGKILGTYEEFTSILIGTGKIGSALLENFVFIVEGYDCLAAFDASPDMIGKEINSVKVHDAAELEAFLKENRVDIAILTVPRAPAQRITDMLVSSGVKAIWNFTNEDLDVGESDVFIENVHFSDSLLHLNYYLAKRVRGE